MIAGTLMRSASTCGLQQPLSRIVLGGESLSPDMPELDDLVALWDAAAEAVSLS